MNIYPSKWIQLIILASFFIISNSSAMVNHSAGLHLQLPDSLIDVKNSDIEEIQVFQTSPGSASAIISLKPSAAARLHKLTEEQVGKSVVWIWDGRVLSMEVLKSPLPKDFTVYNFTSFEADEFKRKTSKTVS
ncbi:MAG: hypothetical protein H0U71_03780 [Gammaproteobacteria bacterium]|nr:hypothetical protein [Gammaproteobacteria bacterium]